MKRNVKTVKYFCATLKSVKEQAEFIISQDLIPKQLLLHIGTNDLENMTSQNVFTETCKDIFQLLSNENFNNCKILISSIFQRSDEYQNRVTFANNVLNKLCQEFKFDLITHDNINGDTLSDEKHLHRYKGFPSFLRNIRTALFGIAATQTRQNPYGPPRMMNKFRSGFGQAQQLWPNMINPYARPMITPPMPLPQRNSFMNNFIPAFGGRPF